MGADSPALAGIHNPEVRERMLPLLANLRMASARVRALRAVKFASDDVAVHGRVFPGWGLSLARDAATISEPRYSSKKCAPVHVLFHTCQLGSWNDYLSGYRFEGRSVRSAAARSHGSGHRLQRKPRRSGAGVSDQGFSALHVVDLNGAFEGRSVNADAVSAILKAISIPVQLGGGIRTLEAISHWLSQGVARVILGTAAVRNPALVKELARAFPARLRSESTRRRAGRGPRLGGDLGAIRSRDGPTPRRCGRLRDHLHRHKPGRNADGIEPRCDGGIGALRFKSL